MQMCIFFLFFMHSLVRRRKNKRSTFPALVLQPELRWADYNSTKQIHPSVNPQSQETSFFCARQSLSDTEESREQKQLCHF